MNLTTYVARHTFATVLKRSGVNIAIISESLGHSDLVHYPIQSNTMDTNPLTRVEIWHLENVLFKLYRTIQSCVDSIDPGLINLFAIL